MEPPRETLQALYRAIFRIRRVQLRIESLYRLDEMKTPVHLCIGQEAVAVGVCAALRREDYISSTHRGHGHYLAKGGDLKSMIAELYCRETGCSKGRGGSMHLVDTSVGHIGSSSIVGGSIPIAVGLGLSIRMKGEDRVSVAFFGDGAADEGVLYESVNFAILKRLPVIFVYENNQFSVCSPVSSRQAGEIIFHRTPSDLMHSCVVNGNDAVEVYGEAETAVLRARGGAGPSFIECKTYRVREHAGAGSDSSGAYRTAGEIASWESRCPLVILRDRLRAERNADPRELDDMEKAVDSEIDEAFRFAQESPLPRGEDVHLHLFCE
ncbi:MAG: thiamine pyrophosphate-dependent dehydrogenase E1 component subunit alpha [Candidatus Aureabacteria bacterium]|nr:thiamine pyrophosphate-dependent dehydrogenase E1 component subunit alpha [Candidatus Auribacterota bacterium]